jgi:hypothetical protein
MDGTLDKMNFSSAMLDVYDLYQKEPNDRTTELYWKVLSKYRLNTVLTALEKCLLSCKYFPRPSDIVERISESFKSKYETKTDDTWLGWLLTINPNEAKYFEHKLNDRDKVVLLKHLNDNGVSGFVSRESKVVDLDEIAKGIKHINI